MFVYVSSIQNEILLHLMYLFCFQWEAFSLPELESFLNVLNREEFEYIEQVKTKFRLLKVQMVKKVKELESKSSAACGGKRKPVFV